MEKQKKENCENLKNDKAKREFIKNKLIGIGAVGVVTGVLVSPLASSVSEIGDLTRGSTAGKVNYLDADKLDDISGEAYRPCTSCSWTCTGSCTGSCDGSCSGGCTGSCTSCTSCSGGCIGTCINSCGEGCNGCMGV